MISEYDHWSMISVLPATVEDRVAQVVWESSSWLDPEFYPQNANIKIFYFCDENAVNWVSWGKFLTFLQQKSSVLRFYGGLRTLWGWPHFYPVSLQKSYKFWKPLKSPPKPSVTIKTLKSQLDASCSSLMEGIVIWVCQQLVRSKAKIKVLRLIVIVLSGLVHLIYMPLRSC